MAKRKRLTAAAEVPSDLLDAVHRVPWDLPDLPMGAIDDWQARFARLHTHRGYTTACAEAVATVSTVLQGLDWTRESATFLAGCIEANLFAQRGADRFGPPRFDHDDRTRRIWYTAWWLLYCWERGVPPEPLLALLVIAFEGGPRALAELWERTHRHPASCTVGTLRLLEETGDEVTLAKAFEVIRKLAWRRTPTTLRDDFPELCAELDLATWEVLQERCGTITPLQTLFLGLDNRLADIPGVIGNRLRQQHLLEPARRDLEIEIDPRPRATTSPPTTLGVDTLLRMLEAQAAPATLAALMRPESDAVIAAAHETNTKEIQRDRERIRKYLERLI